MAYLGNDLQVAFPVYRNIDDISGSFNSVLTTFPLTVSGVAPVPAPLYSQQCLISVGGVVQRPDDSGTEGFRLSGSNIIFASAPATGADFFGVILAGADYINAGANFPSGSAAVPSITFDSDLDTGIYNSGANQVSITTSGTERLRIDSAGQIESVSLGTAAAPAFSFTTDANTGIYSPGADQVAISTGGSGRLFINASGNVGIGAAPAAWASTAYALQVGGRGFINGSSNLTIVGNNYYDNGTNTIYIASAAASDYYQSGGEHVWRGAASGTAGNAVSFSERMRLTSTGLGVGTSSPQAKTHISATTSDTTAASYNQGQLVVSDSDAENSGLVLGYRYNAGVVEYGRIQAVSGSTATNLILQGAGGNVGIGTTSPIEALHVEKNYDGATVIRVANSDAGSAAGSYLQLRSGSKFTNLQNYGAGNLFLIAGSGGVNTYYSDFDTHIWRNNGGTAERARIDSSGRLLVGTSSAQGNNQLQIQADNVDGGGALFLRLGKDATAINTPGFYLGTLNFGNQQGGVGASIRGESDAAWSGTGSTDNPGRLVFSTTADGASSPTERMRIAQNGVITIQNGAVAVIGTLTDGATITPDFAADCNFTVTLGGNRTLANPTNITAGQSGSIFIVQDATGSRTLSWGSYWDFPGGTAPTLSTAANAVDRIDYIVRSSTSIHTVFTANYS